MKMGSMPRADQAPTRAPHASIFAAAAILVALVAAAFAAPANASIGIESFETTSSSEQAGGHPDLTTTFTLESVNEAHEAAKNVIFNAPQGVFGNPNALTRCTESDFALQECPVNSQAGLITIRADYEGDDEYLLGTAPVFDMVPQAVETARFSFIVPPPLGIPITIPVAVRTGDDYGLRFSVADITQQIPLRSVKFTLWGLPGLTTHNQDRFKKGSPGNPAGCPGLEDTSCGGTNATVSINVKPLINNPTTCSGESLTTELDVQSYQEPGVLRHATSEYPPVTGCERETFNPVLAASLTTGEADSASGLNLGFRVPQTLGFTPSPSQAKDVIVTLPEGLNINPDAADGQTKCTDAQARFNSEAPGECPDNAKIGTVSLGTPALDGPLTGSIYIGEPKPGDQYRLFMILSGFGMNAKLVGSVQPDPATGRVTARFEDLPQVPFENFGIHLFASDRGLMATPTHCTIYKIDAVFVPWNARLANQTSEQFFPLTSGPGGSSCPGQIRPFNPRLVAGASNPVGGAYSSFHLKLDRDDGDQFLRDLTFRMPPGFTGNLRGISYCPAAGIAAAAQNAGRSELVAASCPADSQVGTTNVAAGPGGHPFHVVGKMYLAGPFKGAPLSVVAVTPALAGPYDYGVVVVRVALHVDPLTAQVFAASDTVPSIISGIPIRMRSIQVNIDRASFAINPTNCAPFTVASQGIGDQGTVTNFSSYFHAVNCASLGFKPKMRIKQLGGHKATKRAKNAGLLIDLWTRKGDANVKSISVTLASAFEIDQRHLGNICSEKELAEKQCAGRTPIGRATTMTPLLDQPLAGPVYAVSGSGGLPRLAFILNGQVNLVPRADTKTVKGGRLKTTVPVVPDAPIGHFRLNVFGGKTGYLINTRDICAHRPRITINYVGQNNRRHKQMVNVKARCGKRKARHGRHRIR
jgi:hypothetical protein